MSRSRSRAAAHPGCGQARRYYLTADRQIWFFTIYGKDEATDLSQDEKKALKKAIQNELTLRRSSDD